MKGYDYAQAGLYFVTICTQHKAHLFGDIETNQHSAEIILNDAGKIANECWLAIPKHFPSAILHEHIIMPNHIHGIVELTVDNVGAEYFPPENNHHLPDVNRENNENRTNDANGAKIFCPYVEHRKQLVRWCVVLKLG